MVAPETIAEVMGGAAVLGRRVRSLQDLDAAVAHGIPKQALRLVAQRVSGSAGEVRQTMFGIVPEATWKRRIRLSAAESERTERLARVIAAAEQAWSDAGEARRWLLVPHSELGRRSPLETARTELGARRVEELLERLIYGLPA